jgi:hypothetical protein
MMHLPLQRRLAVVQLGCMHRPKGSNPGRAGGVVQDKPGAKFQSDGMTLCFVMPALVAGIHVLLAASQ